MRHQKEGKKYSLSPTHTHTIGRTMNVEHCQYQITMIKAGLLVEVRPLIEYLREWLLSLKIEYEENEPKQVFTLFISRNAKCEMDSFHCFAIKHYHK